MTTPKQNDKELIELILQTPIFSKIDKRICESLLPYLQKIKLKQTDILFHQGELSDSLYILVDGQLIAFLPIKEGEKKIIGLIEKGETVGELGALSNQPRTLSLIAAMDSVVLKFPRDKFQNFIKEFPEVVSQIINVIINRSQNTIKLISKKKPHQHIAIIRGDETNIDLFMEKLNKNNFHDEKFILIDHYTHGSLLNNRLQQIENEHRSAVFVLDKEDLSPIKSKLNHISGIYIIVDGDKLGYLSDFALEILKRDKTSFATQYELILMHDDKIDMPTGTKAWLEQSHFTLHHHIRKNDDAGYQKIWRFIRGKAVGLVLGGGGAKGWVCIGVIKALEEAGIPIDSIGGTSAGGVIAACYARELSYKKTYEAYQNASKPGDDVFKITNLTWPIISLFSATNATETIKRIFQTHYIEDLWLPYFAISSNLNTGEEHVHKSGFIWECVRATLALPGIAPPIVFNGELHYDGGLLNNLPVDQMRAMLGDDSIIIAVTLTGTKEHRNLEKYNFPPSIPFYIGLLKKLGLGYNHYHFPPFFSTFINALLLGASAKEDSNQLKADILIAPDLSMYALLDISSKKNKLFIDIGYQSTKEKLNKILTFVHGV